MDLESPFITLFCGMILPKMSGGSTRVEKAQRLGVVQQESPPQVWAMAVGF